MLRAGRQVQAEVVTDAEVGVHRLVGAVRAGPIEGVDPQPSRTLPVTLKILDGKEARDREHDRGRSEEGEGDAEDDALGVVQEGELPGEHARRREAEKKEREEEAVERVAASVLAAKGALLLEVFGEGRGAHVPPPIARMASLISADPPVARMYA